MSWLAAVGSAHFLLPVETHAEHALHILLAGLFLVPIFHAAAADWTRGGLLAAGATSVLYGAHLLWSWRGSPLANLDQLAMIGVYVVAGFAAGRLFAQAGIWHWQRDEVARRGRLSEQLQGLAALIAALEARSPAAAAHSRSVAEWSRELGRELGLEEPRLELLRLAGLTHDVGKIGLPDTILNGTATLSPEERAAARRHVGVTRDLLARVTGAEEIARIVSSHHENLDGTGYPDRLQREEIPLEARILRVADVFSALTEERSYRHAAGASAALAELAGKTGVQFDPAVLAALERVLARHAGEPRAHQPRPAQH